MPYEAGDSTPEAGPDRCGARAAISLVGVALAKDLQVERAIEAKRRRGNLY